MPKKYRRRMLSKLDHEEAEKKLNRIRLLLKKVNNNINRFVEKYKFKRIPSNKISSSNLIFTNKKLGVVVKVPYLTRGIDEFPAHSIPTVAVKRTHSKDSNYSHILIQPLGKLINTKKAHAMLQRRVDVISDDHEGNVAWYKNCPVWIDW